MAARRGRLPANPGPFKPQSAARKNVWGMSVTVDVTDMLRLLRRLNRQSRAGSVRPAIEAAHRNMGAFLQAEIMEELDKRIKDRGRVQRGGSLFRALGNENAIEADASGFTFGFLENARGNVRLYARNLELGTDVHVGTELTGFITEGGQFVKATRDRELQRDPRLVQVSDEFRSQFEARKGARKFSAGHFGSDEADDHIVTVKRSIAGYHYFSGGMDRFRRGFGGFGGLSESMAAAYHGAFREYGLDVFEIFFAEYGLMPPDAGRAAVRMHEGRAIEEGDPQWISY
jgi:hypothetical protein